MTEASPRADVQVDEVTLRWLLSSDPAIRWQVLRDLTDASPELVARERGKVAEEGWGADLLSRQRPDGQWGDGAAHPLWWTNLYSLVWLRDLGVHHDSPPVRTAIRRIRAGVTWGQCHGHSPFFEGETEPCINGRVVALASYFRERPSELVERLLGEQLDDGGWNCEAERGSVRSSVHTTICVLEGLLEYERVFGPTDRMSAARARGERYLLDRRLLRRRSTGEEIDPRMSDLTFPPLWHYDILRALDYLRASGATPDERADEALHRVLERRTGDGRWLLEVQHPDVLYPEMTGRVGEPNRWITLRALRVIAWGRAGPGLDGRR